MFIIYYIYFIASSILLSEGNFLSDFQENQKYGEQTLDYDYPVWYSTGVSELSRPSELMQYDIGHLMSHIAADKRGSATQSSGGIWFGPRLGRRKRRSSYNLVDVNSNGPEAGVASASQTVVDLLTNAPWVLIPLVENSLYNQQKLPISIRNSRSSSEEASEEATRHSARSPPYSPPFSPRLGRHVGSVIRPFQVSGLNRDEFFRRDTRSLPQKPAQGSTAQPSN
ncbi:uncharacterized protein LOC126893664 [Daktulosphaira vitifoliae]|uniref:uncharacterized protein LOC126893664 n=1 Tax=Daktulosphaira vitifoliae TaxID=58002 RepID=UPI0021AAF201|nr:uncharacterized protein LOC126893664 [Daktulosphaira vitifoliae]